MYHDCGERFCSPTINLFMKVEDYFLFCENLALYLQTPLLEFTEHTENYPVGVLTANKQSVKIYFMHYKSFTQAKEKWEERCQRIDFENLFIFMEAGIDTTDDIVRRFAQLPYKNKMIITNKPYPEVSCAKYLALYDENYNYGKILSYKYRLFKWRFLNDVNYKSWLNGK